jgi:hypothetical protein
MDEVHFALCLKRDKMLGHFFGSLIEFVFRYRFSEPVFNDSMRAYVLHANAKFGFDSFVHSVGFRC